MTIANALGEMFRRELQTQMVPLQQAVQRMEGSLEALDELREVTYRLEPLISRLGSMAGVRTASVLPAPVSARGRGGAGRAAAVRGPARVRLAEGLRGCAVIGCERQSRSKGYCSAHYQKLRLLMKTNRRPAEWVDDAQPQSVQDVQLPRGRAASKALKEGAPAPRAPAEAAPEPTEAEAPAKGRGRGRGKAARGKRGARKQARQAKPARQAKAKGAAKRGKRGGRK